LAKNACPDKIKGVTDMDERSKACSDDECSRESCEGCEKNPKSFQVKTNELNTIKKVIGVVSGKGGVGSPLSPPCWLC
jgi:Mrp family chromosome partitioning ATPase